jgi:hypothetical protein
MSNGGTSNTGGKRNDLPAFDAKSDFPRRGKVLSELLQRLDAQKRASMPPPTRQTARGTAAGVRAHAPRKPPFAPNASRKRVSVVTVALAVALGLVGAAIIAAYLIRPEAALPAPEGLLQTRIQMKGMEMAVRMYYGKYHKIPQGSVSNILAVLAAENRDNQNPDRMIFMKLRRPEYRFGQIVKPGDIDENWNYLDGWGRPMSLEVHPETVSMRIRSMGPNGKDEHGEGDDIEMLILANE